jgi:hypothetical protein
MAFSAPSSSNLESVKIADLKGHLLIVEPIEYKTGIPTVHGDAEAIEVHISDLDTGLVHRSVLLFGVVLRKSLRDKIGHKVLGRVVQGPPSPGKSGAWELKDATGDADAVAKANAFIGNAGAPAPVAAPSANINDPAVQALLAQLGAKPVN